MVTPFSSACWYADFMPERPAPLYLCLDAQSLKELAPTTAPSGKLRILADTLLRMVDMAVPSIGDRPMLRAHLTANRGREITLIPDGFEYLYRFDN